MKDNLQETLLVFLFFFIILFLLYCKYFIINEINTCDSLKDKKTLEVLNPSGSVIQNEGSSETTREVYYFKDNLFKFWFIGFLEGKGSFMFDKEGNLEFKLVHSSQDAQILFFIKKTRIWYG